MNKFKIGISEIISFIFMVIIVIYVLASFAGSGLMFYMYFFEEDSATEIYNKLQNNENVDLINLKTMKLRRILSLSDKKRTEYYQDIKEYKKNIKEYNYLKVLYEDNKPDPDPYASFIDCQMPDISPNEKVRIECESSLNSEVTSYVNNSCYALYYDDEGLYSDDIEYLGGVIVCSPLSDLGRAMSSQCEPFGTSISCTSKPTRPNLDTYVLDESITKKIKKIINSRLSSKFKGRCKSDCSGHISGYDWAKKKKIIKAKDCLGKSQSFIEGCLTYVSEL